MFLYLCKVLFLGFLQFQGDFVDGQNKSKYCDRAALKILKVLILDMVYKERVMNTGTEAAIYHRSCTHNLSSREINA